MSIANFTITLQRPGMGSKHDDVITVTPFMDEFKIQYTNKNEKIKHFHYCSDEQVVKYVEDLFYLLPSDNVDGFAYIQFDFPCFPAVMFSVAEFDNKVVRHTIRDRLWAVLQNWPEKVRYESVA
jgi:hypothetical protein